VLINKLRVLNWVIISLKPGAEDKAELVDDLLTQSALAVEYVFINYISISMNVGSRTQIEDIAKATFFPPRL
jgi:hypothetical protein